MGVCGLIENMLEFAFVSAHLSSEVASTSLTISGVSFGAIDADRAIFVTETTAEAGGGRADSCTIGGVAATRAAGTVGATSDGAAIWVASVPAGTSGSVVFGYPNADKKFTHAVVYRAVGFSSLAAIDSTSGGTPATTSFTLAGTPGGVILACRSAYKGTGAIGPFSVSGIINNSDVASRYPGVALADMLRHMSASVEMATNSASVTITPPASSDTLVWQPWCLATFA